jgi:MFS family permease
MSLNFSVYVLRLTLDFGLSFQQAMSINFCYFVLSVIFEIPTGVFADKKGTKLSIQLGAFFWFLGIFIYAAGNNFYWFMLAESAAALGSSFLSGASDNWLSQQKNYQSLARKSAYILTILSIPTGLIAGFLAQYQGRTSVYVLSTIILGLSFVLTFKIRYIEDAKSLFESRKVEPTSFFQKLKILPKRMAIHAIFIGISAIGLSSFFMLCSNQFEASGYTQVIISFITSMIALFDGLGVWIEKKFESRDLKTSGILLSIRGLMILFLAISFYSGIFYLPVLAFAGFQVVNGVYKYQMQMALIEETKSLKNKTTIRSAHSALDRSIGSIGMITMGTVATSIGITQTWVIASCITIVCGYTIYKLLKR